MTILVNLSSQSLATDYEVIGDVSHGFVHVAKRNPEAGEDCGGFDTEVSNCVNIRVLVAGTTQTADSLEDAAQKESILIYSEDHNWAETMDPAFTEAAK
jgi:hypothetical protein